MAIFVRCLACKKAAPHEDRDEFMNGHKESCGSDTRFRSFEAEDETQSDIKVYKSKPEPEVADDPEPEEKVSKKKKKFSKKS